MNQPQLYSEVNQLQIRDNTFVLDQFLKLIKFHTDSETVLDVGIGDGKFAIEYLIPRLPKGYGKFFGTDISESMLTFAKEKYRLPNVDFKQFDIGADTIPAELVNSSNHIFSFFALHWVRNQRKTFANIHKILKPGGDMLVSFLVKLPYDEPYKMLSKRPKWKQYDHTKLISPYSESKEPKRELEKILTDTGFSNIVCEVKENTCVCATFEDLQSFIVSTNPYVLNMSLDDRRLYIHDLMEDMKTGKCYKTKIIKGKEVFEIDYSLFIIYASKNMSK